MGWGKVILVFQAVVTLIFGIIFFSVILMDKPATTDEAINTTDLNLNKISADFEFRFKTAGYILVVVSLMEIMIISKFV